MGSELFDSWNEKKQHIQKNLKELPCQEGEVWWCSLGKNIGTEQNGKNDYFERPILVLNRINHYTIWSLPLSSKSKLDKYRYSIEEMHAQIVLSQLRTISTKRLLRKITKISDGEFNSVIDKVVELLINKKRNPAKAGNLGGVSLL